MNTCTLSRREVRIATIELQLRDLAALRAACWLLRWELRAGQRTYRAFGRPGAPCAHAIGVPGCAFEIGLIDQGGHWFPAWDAGLSPDLDRALGPGGLNLWRSYLRETIRRASQPRGHTFNQHTDIGGVLRVRIGGSHSQQGAHVRMAADGATSLWTFGPGAWTAYRYLGEALGRLDDAYLSDGALDDPVSR